jgi:hypothetical protein
MTTGEPTREKMPAEWDAAERRRSLLQHWVEQGYEVVGGVLRWDRDDYAEEGRGYFPIATPAIAGDFVRIQVGDVEALCAFARRWGLLEYDLLVTPESPDSPRHAYGDPLAWVWAHLAGMQTALTLWKFWREKNVAALAQYLNKRRLSQAQLHVLERLNKLLVEGRFVQAQRRMEEHFAGLPWSASQGDEIVIVSGDNGRIRPERYFADRIDVHSWPDAWRIIRRIINPNLRGVHAEISLYFDGIRDEPIVGLGWDALISVIYRHVFEIMSSGQIEECRECQTPFIRTDGRQRFCPPPPSARESQCAMRFHKREQRRRARGEAV